MPSCLFERIFQKVKSKSLISPHDSILIALSGGPDSVFLLYFLLYLQKKIDFNIGIAHLNHLLRSGEAERDQLFCKKLSERYSLPFFTDWIDVKAYAREQGLSMEDAARKKRYDFLLNVARMHNYNKIATAHTLDDLVETFFMRIARGTGIFGLKGVPFIRHEGSIDIIRPLLEVSKNDILNYLNTENISYMIDSTNFSEKYLRNYIRHNILPLFLSINPNLKERILDLSIQAGEVETFLKYEIDKNFNSILMYHSKTEGIIKLDIKRLNEVPEFLKGFILRKSIELLSGSIKGIYTEHINKVLGVVKYSKGEKDYFLPNDLRVKRTYDSLFLYKNTPFLFKKTSPFRYELYIGKDFYLKDIGIHIHIFSPSAPPENYSFDIIYKLPYNIFKQGLVLRNRQNGDRFNGKKLKKVFIDKKIPRYLRDKIPVIALDNKILTVIGILDYKQKEELKDYVVVGVKFKRGGILWNELWKRLLSQKKKFKKELDN